MADSIDTGQSGASAETRAARYETYEGGGPEAERLVFDRLARELMRVQLRNKRRAGAATVQRAFHAKAVLGVENARLRFHDELPEALRVGWARPGARYEVTVRLSNASGTAGPDGAPDLRGAALRVRVRAEEFHDLLMTNSPVSHARDAREFVAFAKAMAGADSMPRKALGLYVKLPLAVGWWPAVRMRRNITNAVRRTVGSLARETYWSRGAILWGEAGPVRFLLRPLITPTPYPGPGPIPGSGSGPEVRGDDPDRYDPDRYDPGRLGHELARRLAVSDVRFELCVQRFVNERRTPVENGAVDWRESVTPVVPVAVLTVPRQDVTTAEARSAARRVEELAFNPWHTTEEFRPLGNLNRARKAAYQASAAHRLGTRFHTEEPLRNTVLGAPLRALFRTVNRYVPWHRLPLPLSLLNLVALRQALRRHNLIDTDVPEAPPRAVPVPRPVDERARTARSYDGSYTDLSAPGMGAVGTAFGRNLEPVYRPDLFDTPNPVTVARSLLHRTDFIPARSLNVLAAAWIQFQVHDWVNHRRHPVGEKAVEVPLPPGAGSWQNSPGGPREDVMRFAENIGLERPTGLPILFANTTTPWWDGSEVYGDDERTAKFLREPDGPGLRLEERSEWSAREDGG